MTNKSQMLNMSLLPIVLLLALILGAGYLLLAGEIDLKELFNHDPEVRRLAGFPTVVSTDREIEKQRVVIKSEEELANFLNNVDSTNSLMLAEKINFNKEILIGISSSTSSETGSTIKVRKLYQDEEDNSLIVSIRQTELGESCEIEMQPNIAVDLVAISKTDRGIEFETAKETKECN